VKRLQDVAFDWLPTAVIRGIMDVHSAGCWPTLGSGVKFVAALGTSVDYYAPAHVDSDFLFSIHQLNVAGMGHHEKDAEVVQYFCFPQQGFAVAMRPSDSILFNSNCFHCLSGKRDVWKDHRVHATSFYVKTGHVGGNDNSRPLTTEEMQYLTMEWN
jgi:hypothetical protein